MPEDLEYDAYDAIARARPGHGPRTAPAGDRTRCCTAPGRWRKTGGAGGRLARPARRRSRRPAVIGVGAALVRAIEDAARAARARRRWTCTRRPRRWASTSGSDTQAYGPEFPDARDRAPGDATGLV